MFKGPKTMKGMIRKASTGDGRKKTDTERLFSGEVDMFGNPRKKAKK